MRKTLLLLTGCFMLASSFIASAQNRKFITAKDDLNPQSLRVKNTPTPSTVNKNAPGQMLTNALSGYYFESFEGTFPPAGWQVIDVQDPTYLWEQSTLAPYTGANSAYISYTSTIGVTGEDWMIMPQFTVASTDSFSFWLMPQFLPYPPDSTLILVSTTDSAISSFTTVLATLAEGLNYPSTTDYQNYSYSLSAYAGQDIYIAIVNKNDYGDGVFIDDVSIGSLPANDMSAYSVDGMVNEYTQIPLIQASGMIFNATVKNAGGAATTGGSALFELINTTTSAVAYSETVSIPNLAAGATAGVNTTTPYTISTIDSYKVRLTTTLSGDGNSSNDMIESATFATTDSTFARDNDVNLGSLGIGAGPNSDGIIGQNFAVNNPASLTSVSFYITSNFDPNPAGSPVWATIHTQAPGSEPSSTVIATTDTVVILPGTIAAPGQWFTVPVSGAPASLGSGLYFAGVHEYDSLLTLGTSAAIVSPNSVWVSWNSIPTPPAVNGWAQASDFGFTITYQLRLNLGVPTGIIENNTIVGSVESYPNPFSDVATINLSLKQSADVKVVITDVLGNELTVLCDKNLPQGGNMFNWDASAFAKGIYFCNITADGKTFTQKLVKF